MIQKIDDNLVLGMFKKLEYIMMEDIKSDDVDDSGDRLIDMQEVEKAINNIMNSWG